MGLGWGFKVKLNKLNDLIEDGEAVKGRWEITPDHDIQYKKIGDDEEIKVSGSLVAAEPGVLVIGVTERQTNQKIVTSIYKLTGTWKANSQNQLVFEIAKENGKKDALLFRSKWKINDQHQIVYTYERVNLKKKKKESQELSFEGYWDISEKNLLTYFLGGDSDSAFRFRGAFQTKSILAKRGEIHYQIGVLVSGKHKLQTIGLFGKWKLSRNLDLSFEIDYEDRKRSIVFGREYSLDSQRRVIVNLRSEEGKALGVEVILEKDIFDGNGQAFIRFQKFVEESRVEAGVKFTW